MQCWTLTAIIDAEERPILRRSMSVTGTLNVGQGLQVTVLAQIECRGQ